MARYNFNLRDSKSDKPTPIYLIIRYSNKRVKFYTRESIDPRHWDFEDQYAKQTKNSLNILNLIIGLTALDHC